MDVCRCLAITISTRSDITIDQGKYIGIKLQKWKHYKGGCGILEYSTGSNPKWHFHGTIFISKEATHFKDQLKNKVIARAMSGIFNPEDYDIKHAIRLCEVYNDDWVQEYLTKENDSVELWEDIPEDREQYYVPKEIQEKRMAAASKFKLNPEYEYWDELLDEYIENFEPYDEKSKIWKEIKFLDKEAIEHFLTDMWFDQRKIKVPPQVRIMKEKVTVFYAWRTRGSIKLL